MGRGALREFEDGEAIAGTRYRVVALIGEGGMGAVYEVEHVELGKRFVLKAMQRELAQREDLVARLRQEWRALARLEHPNIVGVTDAGTSGTGVPFYVMERLEGETLSARLARMGPLPLEEALEIGSGILDGLVAAHEIGIVHRDVKPPNIFLTSAGGVKLLDFGVAKIADTRADVITARGVAIGTPRYMSPEQVRGDRVDLRTDLYATGLVLFEMVAGVGPFIDAEADRILLAHLTRPPPRLSSVAFGVPRELDDVVAAMLLKDPRERPASARPVADLLRRLAAGAAPAWRPPGPAVRRSSPPPASLPGTRPDGVAARGSERPPALGPGQTLRMDPLALAATIASSTLAPDSGATRVEPMSFGTLRMEGVAFPKRASDSPPDPNRTLTLEELGVVSRRLPEPEPTRTAVPLPPSAAETPPPVAARPVPAAPPRAKQWVGAAVALGGALVAVVLGVVAIRATARSGRGEAERAAPSAAESAPSAAESAPSAAESAPSAAESAPSAAESAPSAAESAPSAAESAPSAAESAPSAAESTPSAAESAPPAAESAGAAHAGLRPVSRPPPPSLRPRPPVPKPRPTGPKPLSPVLPASGL